MSARQQPANLNDLLAVNPLLHLIPKQAIMPLINNPQIGAVSDESILKPHSGGKLDTNNAQMMEELGGEEVFEDDEEIDQIMSQFKYKKYNTTSDEPLIDPKISSFEMKQADKIEFNDDQLIPYNNSIVKTARLSVRKKYNPNEMKSHNEKYVKKFNNQLQIFNDVNKENTQETESQKRLIESSEEENDKEIQFQQQRKLVKYTDGEMKDSALRHLTDLIETDPEKAISFMELEKIFDVLTRVGISKDANIDYLNSIQQRCFKYVFDFLEKDILINDANDIKQNSNEVLGSISAVRSILTIMNNFPGSKSLLIGEYINLIVRFIEFLVNKLISSMASLPLESAIGSESESHFKTFLAKLSDIGLILKQLTQLHLKLPFEEFSLNKLEILFLHLIFDEKLNDEKTVLELVSIDAIRISTANSLMEIAKSTHQEQRDFLLFEILQNFKNLSSKKTAIRRIKIERGLSIQIFTLLVLRLTEYTQNEEEASKITDFIAKQIIQKIDNSNTKLLFDNLLEDLFSVIPFPEWSASECILTALTRNLFTQFTKITSERPIATPQEIFYLDALGLICEKVMSFSYDTNLLLSVHDKNEILAECQNFHSASCPFLKCNYIKIDSSDYTALPYIQNKKSNYLNIIFKNLDGLVTLFINNLDGFLKSSKVKVKTKTVKILAALSYKRPSILTSKIIQESLSSKISDEATSVRDAVYEFIGKYIITHPKEANNFFYPLSNALSDEGISVRKKSIRLSREIWPLLSDDGKIAIGSKLLRRLDDEEDSIKNEAISVMIECWILTTSTDLILLATSSSKNLAYLKLLLQFHVLCETSEPNEMLILSVKKIIEFYNDQEENKEGAYLVISIFTEFKPSLYGQEELTALKPFLLDETNIHEKSYLYALTILKNSTVNLSPLRPDFLPVEEFLISRMTKLSFKQLHQAIPALWQLCTIFNIQTKMILLVKSTLKMIRTAINTMLNERIVVLLRLLACFLKYCDLQKYHEFFMNEGLGLKPKESMSSLVVKHILPFCNENIDYTLQVQTTAISCLVVALTNQTRILMAAPVLQVFDRSFELGNQTIVKAVISSFTEFIKEKDSEMQNGHKVNNQNNFNVIKDITDGICANLVQRYLGNILKLCLIDKGEYSYLPFQFIELAIEYGFAMPKLCIPTIIALEGSTNNIVQQAANKMHKDLYLKQQSLVESSYQGSIRLAFENDLTKQDFFNLIYKNIDANKVSKYKFLQSVIKSFDLTCDSEISFKLNIFIAKRLLLLEFKTIGEIYVILDNLQVMLRGPISDFVEEYEANKMQEVSNKFLAYSMYIIVDLFNYLTAVYRITSEDIDAYGSKCLDIDLNANAKQVKNYRFNINWDEMKLLNDEGISTCVQYIKESL